jgi:hypothetical protein
LHHSASSPNAGGEAVTVLRSAVQISLGVLKPPGANHRGGGLQPQQTVVRVTSEDAPDVQRIVIPALAVENQGQQQLRIRLVLAWIARGLSIISMP